MLCPASNSTPSVPPGGGGNVPVQSSEGMTGNPVYAVGVAAIVVPVRIH